MTQPIRRPRPAPWLVVGALVALAIGARLAGVVAGDPAGLEEPLLAVAPAAEMAMPVAPGDRSQPVERPVGDTLPAVAPSGELADIRADIDFWATRLEANPADIVSAVRLAEVHVAEARVTGDATAYARAEAAADAALDAQPRYGPAQAVKAGILVALHRFAEARTLATAVLERTPDDPTALGVLGDASLELGDLNTARTAYADLSTLADGSAARLRQGRLAFLSGDPRTAIDATRGATVAAHDEGLEDDSLAFPWVTLGELLRATGDEHGARSAYETALEARPGHPAANVGLARLDAFAGDLDSAIGHLDPALAAVPNPDWLALRAELLTRRGSTGDAAAADGDRATIDAIAALADDVAGVYDRGLALYLADTAIDPDRAVRLAEAELVVRPDLYGHDTLAWALFAAGRAREAQGPMTRALDAGTRDARLWMHAGLIAAANGDGEAARTYLADALALGPALDPMARERAEAALADLP
jgi:tetratricopeptide (TPR) repeat protein